MITCEDILNLKLDGMHLIAGEKGLYRMVSWVYMVQTRPYADHMNRGNFALIVVDYVRFDFKEVAVTLEELNELGISGLAISVVDDREEVPESVRRRADELELPLPSAKREVNFALQLTYNSIRSRHYFNSLYILFSPTLFLHYG